MGIIDKLKDILFDEETVEIPIITEEEYESLKPKKNKKAPKVSKVVTEEKEEDEIKVSKIENVKRRAKPVDEEEEKKESTLFDMPKLKEEADEEVRTSSFTFPVFDDDELLVNNEPKRASKPASASFSKRTTTDSGFVPFEESIKEPAPRKTPTTNSYSSSYNSTIREEKKPFTLSPIISPVYGILNENYTKDDIVSKQERVFSRSSFDKPNLDDVRKKAYGVVEDEIDITLTNEIAVVSDSTPDEEVGISIDDLLANDDEEKIEIEEQKKEKPKEKEEEPTDDLFDLIDSLYDEKGDGN